MLSDPQSVTVNAVAIPLPLKIQRERERIYENADGTLQLLTRQQVTKDGFRREARLTPTIVATDPLTTLQDYQSCSVYMVIAEPRVGFTDAQIEYYIDALKAWFTANQTDFITGEF